jgi:hypothetical protein
MNYDLIYNILAIDKFSPTFTKMMDMIGEMQTQVNALAASMPNLGNVGITDTSSNPAIVQATKMQAALASLPTVYPITKLPNQIANLHSTAAQVAAMQNSANLPANIAVTCQNLASPSMLSQTFNGGPDFAEIVKQLNKMNDTLSQMNKSFQINAAGMKTLLQKNRMLVGMGLASQPHYSTDTFDIFIGKLKPSLDNLGYLVSIVTALGWLAPLFKAQKLATIAESAIAVNNAGKIVATGAGSATEMAATAGAAELAGAGGAAGMAATAGATELAGAGGAAVAESGILASFGAALFAATAAELALIAAPVVAGAGLLAYAGYKRHVENADDDATESLHRATVAQKAQMLALQERMLAKKRAELDRPAMAVAKAHAAANHAVIQNQRGYGQPLHVSGVGLVAKAQAIIRVKIDTTITVRDPGKIVHGLIETIGNPNFDVGLNGIY